MCVCGGWGREGATKRKEGGAEDQQIIPTFGFVVCWLSSHSTTLQKENKKGWLLLFLKRFHVQGLHLASVSSLCSQLPLSSPAFSSLSSQCPLDPSPLCLSHCDLVLDT